MFDLYFSNNFFGKFCNISNAIFKVYFIDLRLEVNFDPKRPFKLIFHKDKLNIHFDIYSLRPFYNKQF